MSKFLLLISKEWKYIVFSFWYPSLLITSSIIPIIFLCKMGQSCVSKILSSELYIKFIMRNFIEGDAQSVLQTLENIFTTIAFVIPLFIVIILTLVLYVVHKILLNKLAFRKYILSNTGRLSDDVFFIKTWLLISAVFNSIILMIGIDGIIYQIISIYFIQDFVFYLLLKTNAYNYKLVLRRKQVST